MAVQLLATVMIPVSVAGTGLYYTRWQQNLNDLKTMIDLVSDQIRSGANMAWPCLSIC